VKAEPRKPDESPAPPDTLSSKTLNATVYRETAAVCLRCVSGMAPDTKCHHCRYALLTCALVSLCTYHTQSRSLLGREQRHTRDMREWIKEGEREDTNVLLCRGGLRMIYGPQRDIWRFFVVGGGRGGSRAWCRCSSRTHTHTRT